MFAKRLLLATHKWVGIVNINCSPNSSFLAVSLKTYVHGFYAVLTSLKLSLSHATIAWFSAYKKAPNKCLALLLNIKITKPKKERHIHELSTHC